jgi:CelD/BcsL family acetyltransferase involved in cellulose biosynthesis
MKNQLEVKVIETWEDFESLSAEWNDLLVHSEADTIFLSFEWIKAWSKVVGKSVKLFILTLRNRSNKLVGLAPFYFKTYRLLHLIPYRVLRTVGDYPTGAEYPDWILHKEWAEPATITIASALLRNRSKWDCVWNPNVMGWTSAKGRFELACRHAHFFCQSRKIEFSCFSLPSKIDAYTSRLSKKFRLNLQRALKKTFIKHAGNIKTCKKASELPVYLDALFDLHYNRWKQKGEIGTFRRKPLEKEFYKQFAPVALDKGWLRFFALEVDEEFKAIQIGYVYNGIYHSLQEGFDPGFMAGVGNVLRYKVIESCIAEGLDIYDFLGGFSEHKSHWLSQLRNGYDIFFGHRCLKNRFLFFHRIWPTGRYFKPVDNFM